jgi:hypothetical protein
VIRELPKMDPSTFLQTLSGAVAPGLASRNQIAIGLSRRTGLPISSQAVRGRSPEGSTAFLTGAMHRLFGERFSSPFSTGGPGVIRRILVEDSPVQTMPKANVAIFPARGKRHRGTAGVKIDFAYDLLAGEVCSHSLHSATEQDKTIGKEFVALVRENDLVLRDMGYFSIGEFIEIELRGAFSKGVEPDAMFMIRDGWHLMITNLPAADFTPNQLRAIYRARRGVELQFLAGNRPTISTRPSIERAANTIPWPSSSRR